jgi:E3 ubiquitin-protein ligase RNF1/2
LPSLLSDCRNNECPACRTHCASRRSLRDDPKFDNLVAAIYPNVDQYEAEVVICACALKILELLHSHKSRPCHSMEVLTRLELNLQEHVMSINERVHKREHTRVMIQYLDVRKVLIQLTFAGH